MGMDPAAEHLRARQTVAVLNVEFRLEIGLELAFGQRLLSLGLHRCLLLEALP